MCKGKVTDRRYQRKGMGFFAVEDRVARPVRGEAGRRRCRRACADPPLLETIHRFWYGMPEWCEESSADRRKSGGPETFSEPHESTSGGPSSSRPSSASEAPRDWPGILLFGMSLNRNGRCLSDKASLCGHPPLDPGVAARVCASSPPSPSGGETCRGCGDQFTVFHSPSSSVSLPGLGCFPRCYAAIDPVERRPEVPVSSRPWSPHPKSRAIARSDLDRAEMRDDALLGSASQPTDQPVRGQTSPNPNPYQPLQSSDPVRPDRELSTIPERGAGEPRECRCLANQSIDQRTASDEVAERDEHT
nr:hypothetical protein CFP56_12385 [Quercus suber]